MDYRILAATLMADLESQVNEYLKIGWQIQGGVSFDPNTKTVMQAMIKP